MQTFLEKRVSQRDHGRRGKTAEQGQEETAGRPRDDAGLPNAIPLSGCLDGVRSTARASFADPGGDGRLDLIEAGADLEGVPPLRVFHNRDQSFTEVSRDWVNADGRPEIHLAGNPLFRESPFAAGLLLRGHAGSPLRTVGDINQQTLKAAEN